MITCKVCGFENEAGASFCGSCGSFLEWTGEKDAEPGPQKTADPKPIQNPTPDGGATGPGTDTQPIPTLDPPPPPPPGGIVCPKCGTVNPPDRVFCLNCATELSPVDTRPIVTTQATGSGGLSGKAGPAILIAAVALVAILAILFAGGILDGASATPSPSVAQVSPPPSTGPTAVASAPASVAPSESASPSPTVPPGPTGFIAFTKVISGNADIVVASADGSTITPLISAPGSDVQFAWSRDNTQIAWAAKDGIRIAKADGSDQVQFTKGGSKDRKPEWSPDDKLIVFGSSRDGDFDLYTQHVGKTDLVALTKNSVDDYDPSWSAVTNKIAFVSARADGKDIWTMNPDGGGLQQLTGKEGQEDDPAWSPDGTKIAFASDRDGTFFIYVMNADGSAVTRLSTGTAVEHDPTWSPDGRFIAFTRASTPQAIAIVDVATHEEAGAITADGANVGFPAWQVP